MILSPSSSRDVPGLVIRSDVKIKQSVKVVVHKFNA